MPTVHLKYYGYHPYNNPTHSERNVELPIAFWFLEHFRNDLPNVIEVGEVTPCYHKPAHAVYDAVTEHATTIKKNAVDVNYQGRNLLSISTIEHIGKGEYGMNPAPELLPIVLKKMLTSKNHLITFALGYNPQLEELIQNERYFILERVAPTKWRQTESRKLDGYKYHSPWYAGNAICVLTNLENLRFEFTTRNVLQVSSRWRAPNWSWKNFVKGSLQEASDKSRVPRSG